MGMIRRSRQENIARARAWHALQLADARAEEQRDTARFLADCTMSPGPGRVVFGRMMTPRGWDWVGLPLERSLGHIAVSGASGAGKTFGAACSIVIQHRRYHPDIVLIVLDKKGELSKLLLHTLLPALPTTVDHLDRLHVIAPHGTEIDGHTYLPHLRVTEPEPGLSPELQTLSITEALTAALGDLGGLRMDHMITRLVQLTVERNLPLTRVRTWLQIPATFTRAAQESRDPLLRAYGAQFPLEPVSSRHALASRIDQFFFQPETQLCLAAPRCFSFRTALETPGSIVILDLCDQRAGSERSLVFWSSLITARLTAALLSRPITEHTPYAVVPAEEWQDGLSRDQARAYMRLSALARFRKVSIITLNQSCAQLAQADPQLPRLIRTNAAIEIAFRTAPEDASVLSPPTLDAAVARAFAQRLTRLRTREASLWIKQYGPQIIRSPRIDLDALRRRAAAADPALRLAILRGVDSERREVLEAHLDREEARSSAVPAGLPVSPAAHDSDPGYPRLG